MVLTANEQAFSDQVLEMALAKIKSLAAEQGLIAEQIAVRDADNGKIDVIVTLTPNA